MKTLLIRNLLLLIALYPSLLYSQILFSNGATVYISDGGVMTSNGGVTLSNSTSFTNHGDLRVTKNSTVALPGTITITTSTSVYGDGNYFIEQDWINNSFFSGDLSTVNLNGNTEQFITSTNGTITEFHNLTLTGNGTGINRRKTLESVDAKIDLTGKLTLNNRECATQTNDLIVLNPSSNAISNTQTFGAEGFVSSESPGYLNWATNSTNSYYFPVGSSEGTLRYRPVKLSPGSSAYNEFNVRMNNFIADNDGYYLDQHVDEITEANTLYYHSIERVNGIDDAKISIAYLGSSDGEWFDIAHWSSGSNLWNSVDANSVETTGNYAFVEKANLNFDPDDPYVLVNSPVELVVPTAFTPDGDIANNDWEIRGLDEAYPNNQVFVYNRWGNLLFTSEQGNYDVNRWDGTYQGSLLPVGSYYFIIEFNDQNQGSASGTVSIILNK